MDTPNTLNPQDEIFSIEQLEARFEMLAVPVPTSTVNPTWSCSLTYNSAA
jgi:hypothetical protein